MPAYSHYMRFPSYSLRLFAFGNPNSVLELLIPGKGFLLALQKAHGHDWVVFLGSIILDYAGIKDNNRIPDLCHLSTTASSILLWRQGPAVKRRTRCTVTIKHYIERVEATVVKQVLISHPFPILLSRLKLLSPPCTCSEYIRTSHTQSCTSLNTNSNSNSENIFDSFLIACFMRPLDTSWIITQSRIILMLICNLLW